MAANIRSLQNGINPIDGASRDDLVVGDVVTVSSLDAATTYAWVLVFAPEGSVATFTGSTSAPSPGDFTVDLEGPYLVRLTVDAGLAGESIQYVRLRALTAGLGLHLVSAGERRDGTGIIPVDIDPEGWANEQNENLLALETAVLAGAPAQQPFVLWVNPNYTPPVARNGSILAPFATIQDALDAAGTPTTLLDQAQGYSIYIASALYDEDLVIPPFRSVNFVIQGLAVLGSFAGLRDITIDLSAAPPFPGPPTRFNVRAFANEGDGNDRFSCNSIIAINTGVAKDLEVMLEGVGLDGDGAPGFDSSQYTTGSCQLSLFRCGVESQDTLDAGIPAIKGPAVSTTGEELVLRSIVQSSIESKAPTPAVREAILASSYDHIEASDFAGNITFNGNPEAQGARSSMGVAPGWFGCAFASSGYTWTGIGGFPDLHLDAASNYSFVTNGWIAAPGGAAQKTLLGISATRSQLFVASTQSQDATAGTLAIGQFAFNPSDWIGTSDFRFGGTVAVSNGALTGTVLLYNVTDAEVVTSTTLTTSSVAPVKLESPALTVGAAAGNLKNSEKIYEVRISVTGALLTDLITLGTAYMLVQ